MYEIWYPNNSIPIDVSVMPGELQNPEYLNFTWNVTSYRDD